MGLNESGKSKHKTMKKQMKQQFSEIFLKFYWLLEIFREDLMQQL